MAVISCALYIFYHCSMKKKLNKIIENLNFKEQKLFILIL